MKRSWASKSQKDSLKDQKPSLRTQNTGQNLRIACISLTIFMDMHLMLISLLNSQTWKTRWQLWRKLLIWSTWSDLQSPNVVSLMLTGIQLTRCQMLGETQRMLRSKTAPFIFTELILENNFRNLSMHGSSKTMRWLVSNLELPAHLCLKMAGWLIWVEIQIKETPERNTITIWELSLLQDSSLEPTSEGSMKRCCMIAFNLNQELKESSTMLTRHLRKLLNLVAPRTPSKDSMTWSDSSTIWPQRDKIEEQKHAQHWLLMNLNCKMDWESLMNLKIQWPQWNREAKMDKAWCSMAKTSVTKQQCGLMPISKETSRNWALSLLTPSTSTLSLENPNLACWFELKLAIKKNLKI